MSKLGMLAKAAMVAGLSSNFGTRPVSSELNLGYMADFGSYPKLDPAPYNPGNGDKKRKAKNKAAKKARKQGRKKK